MWQVALGAALAAGSGFLAKQLIHSNAPKSDQPVDRNSSTSPDFAVQDSTFTEEIPTKGESQGVESIFRFSSSERGSNKQKKKPGCGSGRNKGNAEGLKRNGNGKVVKKCGFKKGDLGVDHESSGSGKKFYVCLKKRRTNRTAPGKCDNCSSKGNSAFGWGVGIGMVCMMSARSGEMNKLNIAMDETSKVVQELKDQLSRRRTSLSSYSSKSEDIREEHTETAFVKPCTQNINGKRIFSFSVTEEGEYASSVLTEEMQPEAIELNHLEAEFTSELQKLHGCNPDGSDFGARADIFNEMGALAEGFDDEMDLSHPYEPNGVHPSELNQKLCQVLIEQQGSQIAELETELQMSHRKLHQKESELQALKDCVRRLTDFSLSTDSDDDLEFHTRCVVNEEEKKQTTSEEFRKSAMVGNKRESMEF
ncbi:unnamed protein product [Cuscuta epithymum]|uniref:Uncharacterized protein n=1 Tax=Cuscuta epithymum TaxID=186058 RepID=A0AAV0DJF4_9ASTE|nr:unnamed protein product [Cuscuta epithymum]